MRQNKTVRPPPPPRPNGNEQTPVSPPTVAEDPDAPYTPRKYYVDGGEVRIIGHQVLELDADGKQLRTMQYTDYTAEQVRTLFRSAEALKAQ